MLYEYNVRFTAFNNMNSISLTCTVKSFHKTSEIKKSDVKKSMQAVLLLLLK